MFNHACSYEVYFFPPLKLIIKIFVEMYSDICALLLSGQKKQRKTHHQFVFVSLTFQIKVNKYRLYGLIHYLLSNS